MDLKRYVRQKYVIQKLIAKGSFGQIYNGENVITHQKVAIKFEPIYNEVQNNNLNKNAQNDLERKMKKNTTLSYKLYLEQEKSKQNQIQKQQVLIYECRTLRCLNGALGFPQIYWYGAHSESNSYSLVMDLLDISISELFKKQSSLKNELGTKSGLINDKQNLSKIKHFSLKTVLMIADQMISRLEFLHKKGFVHCDIKPENMLLGRGYHSNVIYLIDFGLSKRYVDERGNHIDYGESNVVCGTARYMSINGHLGINLSRRDDMESLAYVLIYLLKGSLPWQGLVSKKNQNKSKKRSLDKASDLPNTENYKSSQNQIKVDANISQSYFNDEWNNKSSQNQISQINFHSNNQNIQKNIKSKQQPLKNNESNKENINDLNLEFENSTNNNSKLFDLEKNAEDVNMKADLYNHIAEIKLKTPINVLCEGMPEEFQIFLQQVRSLRFEDEPDYSFYRKLFKSLFIQSGFKYDMKFDWTL